MKPMRSCARIGGNGWLLAAILVLLSGAPAFSSPLGALLNKLPRPRMPKLPGSSRKVPTTHAAAPDYSDRLECRELSLLEGLLHQRADELREHGERLTIMCVGESGVGKSSLIGNIFTIPLGPSPAPAQTREISQTILRLKSDGVPLTITFVDTPGYGDDIELRRDFARITRHIDRRFGAALRLEQRDGMFAAPPVEAGKDPVDVVLFFISPHRFKGWDVEFLKHIHGRCSIIPILAKADTMTKDELDEFRSHVTSKLAEEGIDYYQGPYAVISAAYRNTSSTGSSGRVYPWGTAESENETHSDLPALRRRLVTEGFNDLKASSRLFYCEYRKRALRWHRGWRGALSNTVKFVLAHGLLAFAFGYRPKQVHEMEHAVGCMMYLQKLQMQGKLSPPPWEKQPHRRRKKRHQALPGSDEEDNEAVSAAAPAKTWWGWTHKFFEAPERRWDSRSQEKAPQKWGLWAGT